MPLGSLIFIIIISAVITERLLEGLHKFYWSRKLKVYLVGEDEPHPVGEDVDTGIVQIPWLREFIRCKFCQSWDSMGCLCPYVYNRGSPAKRRGTCN